MVSPMFSRRNFVLRKMEKTGSKVRQPANSLNRFGTSMLLDNPNSFSTQLRRAVILALLLSLTSCAAQRAERQAILDQSDDDHCKQYGALPGTPTYTQCRM